LRKKVFGFLLPVFFSLGLICSLQGHYFPFYKHGAFISQAELCPANPYLLAHYIAIPIVKEKNKEDNKNCCCRFECCCHKRFSAVFFRPFICLLYDYAVYVSL